MQYITTGNRIAVENFTLGDLYTVTFTSGTYINSACIGIGENFVSFQRNEPELLFTLNMETAELVSSIELYSGGSGTNNYNDLTNKPQINDVELVGNKSLSDLGIQPTISDLDTIRSGAAAGATAVQPAALADYQPKIDSSHKLDADLVDDTSSTHKFATAAQISQIEINENNISSINNVTAYLTNSGAKNKLNMPNISGRQVTAIYNNADKPLPAGNYVLYIGTVISEDTDANTCQVIFYDNNSSERVAIYSTANFPRGNNAYIELTLTESVSFINFYASDSNAHSVGDLVTLSNIMICTKDEWALSQTYEAYCPTLAELYEMVKNL